MEFTTDHNDVIHHMEYDYFGKRLATASADGTVKVWSQKSGRWVCTHTLKAHNGSVYKVSWCVPEFGAYLATCGADRVVNVFAEETVNGGVSTFNKVSQWNVPEVCLSLRFSPSSFRLGAGFADGSVRVYSLETELSVVTGTHSLSHSESIITLPGLTAASAAGVRDLAWNPCPFDPPMLALCSGSSVGVVEYGERAHRWLYVCALEPASAAVSCVLWLPATGSLHRTLITSSVDGFVRVYHYYVRGIPEITADTLGGSTYGSGTPVAKLVTLIDIGQPVQDLQLDITNTNLAVIDVTDHLTMLQLSYTGVWQLAQQQNE